MLKFNFISRVSRDKNFFADLVYLIHRLKNEHDITASLYFIGAIESQSTYLTLQKLTKTLGIEDRVEFSKRSIRYNEMSEETRNGYFINYSVGFFLGYSGIECMQNNLKTIFYNIDPHYSNSLKGKYSCYCADLDVLIDLVKKINSNEKEMEKTLLKENQAVLSQFLLQNDDALFLKSILLGKSTSSAFKRLSHTYGTEVK